MPEGPNGVPRFTSLGPLVADKKNLERDDIWIETKRESNIRIKSKFLEYGSFVDDYHSVEGEDRGEVVTVEMKYKEHDTILGETDFFTYTGARVTYVITDIGYIHKVKVNDDLKRLGIGSELIEIALEDMESESVDTVYTKTISSAGRSLMEQFGFKEHGELNDLNPRNEWLFKEI